MPGKLQDTIFKKCDLAGHKPGTRQAYRAGTCQHTCTDIGHCSHAWTLRYSVSGKQVERSFQDSRHESTGRVSYGSGRKLAQDAQLKLTVDKRSGDITFADYGKTGKENFGDACTAFFAAMACADATRSSYRTVLNKGVGPAMGHMTLAQAARAHAVAEELVTVAMKDVDPSRRREARRLITNVLDKAVRQDKIAGHKVTDIEVEDNGKARHDDFVFPAYAQVDYLAREMGVVIWLMRGCGLRINEALAVEKSWFRNDGKTLRVSGQASRDGRRKMPLKHAKKASTETSPCPRGCGRRSGTFPTGRCAPADGIAATRSTPR